MGLVHHPNVVSDGLIGCWDAGNRRSYPGAGTVLTDLAGGVNGTLTNEDDDALNFNSFKGGYLEFDGTDGRVDCGDNLIIGWSEISVCVWALVENSGDTYPKLVSRAHAGCFDFAIGRSSSNYLFCYVNSGYINTPTDSMNDYYGKWTHYAMRWKRGTGDFRLYINGELEATGERYYDTINDAGKYNLSFADRPTEGGGRALNGAMGPVYIYDRALSDDEIKQNYEATKSRFAPRITKSGMFASWDAGDPASYAGGTTLKDTANHYDGTFVNNGSGGDVSFDSANGGSLVFDGSDDYVNITTLPNCSSLARSAIIWLSVDDWPTSDVPQTPFQSAADQFDISFGVTQSGIYFNGGGSTASTAQKSVTLSPVPADGAWICWAMTIDSSGDIVAMYRNAVALTASGTSAGFNIKTGTTIGCRLDGSTIQNSLEGKIG